MFLLFYCIYFSIVCILKLYGLVYMTQRFFNFNFSFFTFLNKTEFMDNSKDGFLVSNIVILGKFYAKYMRVKPRFSVFHNEFLSYFKALELVENINSMELFSIIEECNLQKKPFKIFYSFYFSILFKSPVCFNLSLFFSFFFCLFCMHLILLV